MQPPHLPKPALFFMPCSCGSPHPVLPGSFPVDAILPELKRALTEHGVAVLCAPPGSGKTTRIPLALLSEPAICPGTILTLEPRRVAARAAAAFMARSLGEETGRTVGYRVRLDSRVSSVTRVEMLTEGVLTRRLLRDPELSGVSCVIFDEFHERSLQADLGLALCLEARQALRPDLRLLVMSATLDVGPLRDFLERHCGENCGGTVPLVRAEGRSWPVEIRNLPPPAANNEAFPLERHTANVVRHMLSEENGSLLVFLPGAAEIRRVAERLGALPPDTDVHLLSGALAPAAQDAAIAPPPPGRRKVVLSTALAESSLTIEGVRVVVDAGLARVARFNPATGMGGLATERVTQAGAEQRAGRAGRTESGVCCRLWHTGEILLPHPRAEIQDADLAPLLLDILAWGAQPENLPWLTPPPPPALAAAKRTLLALDAAREEHERLVVTPHGERMARLPLHPRLAHMVLCAPALNMALLPLAACLAALAEERDLLRGRAGADIRLRLSALKEGNAARLRRSAEQIYRLALGIIPGREAPSFRLPAPEEENEAGALLSLAWPERIAHRRGSGYLLACGQGAALLPDDPLAKEEFLAVAELDYGPSRGTGFNKGDNAAGGGGRIFLAAPLDMKSLRDLHGSRIREECALFWDASSQSVQSRRRLRLDALTLEESPLRLADMPPEEVKAALLRGLREAGPACLPWTDELRQRQARVLLLRDLFPAKGSADDPACAWPDVSDAALFTALEEPQNWLSPFLDGITRLAQLTPDRLERAFAALLPWPLDRRLEELAPRRLTVPSGSSVAVDYRAEGGPVLAVKLQEMFGQEDTPRVGGGRCPVTLHLLSPAGRPLQVTQDLAGFWRGSYAAVRAEMRGRYPRHPWPEDPLSAVPTKRTKA